MKPTTIGCRQVVCPLDHLADFLNSGNCPKQGCGFTSAAVLFAEEQKLVDTMIVADLIHLANTRENTIVLVSSDDDMWPGILSCLAAGAHVVHVQTSGLKHSLPYKHSVDGRYTQAEI